MELLELYSFISSNFLGANSRKEAFLIFLSFILLPMVVKLVIDKVDFDVLVSATSDFCVVLDSCCVISSVCCFVINIVVVFDKREDTDVEEGN